MMKKIVAFVSHPIFISVVGLFLISLLIWYAGPLIKFGEDNAAPLASAVARLVCIVVILTLWGLNNLRVQMKANKGNQGLVDDLAENQQGSSSDGSSQAAEEIQQLNARFSEALHTLKKLKFNKRGRAKALYELPWYIIVGPPGSGKTTALVNSSLDFPLAEQFGKGALQGVGGTRNCDWWFTNDAVLIDTAGRYTSQDSHRVVDSSAWEGFLNLLKRNRRRRPINGAIVAISLFDLLTQTDDERTQYAKMIRTRLDELMDKLEIRFPVYLMLTKSDLVSGFSEFFEDLGKEGREQVWGVSLPNAPKPSQSPDFDFFSEELNVLVSNLYERVLSRMHSERDKRRRATIYGFPQQMENLSATIEMFVKQTFIQNRYKFQPYLRGVYFTSGTQDGTPIDRLMSSVSANFGFSRDTTPNMTDRGKSFFIGRLFSDVIFPESELVGANVRYESFIRWATRGTYVALAVITIGVITVWVGSITQHKMYMNEVSDYAIEYRVGKEKLSDFNRDLRGVLPPLNALAKAAVVYDQEEHPWLSGIGMYDARVDEKAEAAYQSNLRELLLPRLVHQLEASIQRGHKGGDLYNTFRIYMMLHHQDKLDNERVREWFDASWDVQFSGEATRRQELKTHLNALLNASFDPIPLNNSLVKQTRETLLRVPVSQRIYARIKSRPEYRQKIDVLNYFGESVRENYKLTRLMKDATNISALYTIDGYKEIDFNENSPVVADVVNERWLLTDDDTKRVDFVADDFSEISEQTREHYVADYIAVWKRMYESLEVSEFSGLREANNTLLRFVDPVYSPFLSIFQVGTANTQVTPPIPPLAKDKAEGSRLGKAATFLLDKRETTKIDKAFSDLHTLMNDTGRGAAPIEKVMDRVREMQEYVAEITLAPDPEKKSFQIAQARYKNGTGNPITTLRAYARTAPKPLNRWLNTLADQTWKVVLSSARTHVNSEWKSQVYTPYRNGLSGRYPIRANAPDELAMFDFAEFFKPSGTLDQFVTTYVKPFVESRTTWDNRVVDGYSMGFSESGLKQIRRGLSIKSILFQKSKTLPSVSIELKPLNMNESDARFILEVGNDKITYNHGPKFWKSVTWSGKDENKRIRVMFEDLSGSLHEKTYSGPWAWFRLMDNSNIRRTSRSNVYQLTFSAEGRSVPYEAKVKSVNNALRKRFISAFNCPESL